jgi:hypothetical protein
MENATERNDREPWSKFDDDLDETSIGVASDEEAAAIDDAADLQMISIRLQKGLLSSLKTIAEFHKVGYQPLIRDLLIRFATAEMKLVLNDLLSKHTEELRLLEADAKRRETMKPIEEFLARERKKA